MTAEPNVHPGFMHRIAAGVIDLVLLAIAVGVVSWLGLAIQGPAPENGTELIDGVTRLWSGHLLPALFVVVLVSMALFWCTINATPGQLLMGARVGRSRNGRPLNPVLALWRSVLLFALGGPVGIPLVTVFLDRRRRGIHDWLSSSEVTLEDESRVGLEDWMEDIG